MLFKILKNHIQITLVGLLSLGCFGCNPTHSNALLPGDQKSQADKPNGASPPGSLGTPTQVSQGTVDNGGGNGLDGKVLESFKIDIRETNEFHEIVEPILKIVREKIPHLGLVFDFLVKQKNIYIVPAALSKISQDRIGVTFNTEQYARQSVKEIWIEKKWYDKASNIERSKLWVHELAMALMYYSKFGLSDNCLDGDLAVGFCKRFSDEKSKDDIKTATLTVNEVEVIRAFTTNLLNPTLKEQSAVKLAAWLEVNGFGTYFVPSTEYTKILSVEQLYERMRFFKVKGWLPKYGGFGDSAKAKSYCDFNFDFDPRTKTLVISLTENPMSDSNELKPKTKYFKILEGARVSFIEQEREGVRTPKMIQVTESKADPVEGTIENDLILSMENSFSFFGSKQIYTKDPKTQKSDFVFPDEFDSNGYRVREVQCLSEPIDLKYQKYIEERSKQK